MGLGRRASGLAAQSHPGAAAQTSEGRGAVEPLIP